MEIIRHFGTWKMRDNKMDLSEKNGFHWIFKQSHYLHRMDANDDDAIILA